MFQNSFRKSIEKGIHTTLSITQNLYVRDNNPGVKPITLANDIASIIDAKGGCEFIWISSKRKTDDDTSSETSTRSDLVADMMVQVCDELIYLDVAGATMKSRLLIDSLNEDIV